MPGFCERDLLKNGFITAKLFRFNGIKSIQIRFFCQVNINIRADFIGVFKIKKPDPGKTESGL